MSQSPAKAFLVALIVLLMVHTCASLAAYRIFTKTEQSSGDSPATEVTTPEQAQRGEKSFRTVTVTRRVTTPLPVYFYVVFGYAGLGIALATGLITWVRHQIGAQ